jgi:hypothetical protein
MVMQHILEIMKGNISYPVYNVLGISKRYDLLIVTLWKKPSVLRQSLFLI